MLYAQVKYIQHRDNLKIKKSKKLKKSKHHKEKSPKISRCYVDEPGIILYVKYFIS